jgi:hypothetical protein
MPEPDRNQPALIGGLIAGLLSVLPIAQAGNVCCCLWAWVGGAVAIKMYVDRAAQRVTWEDALKIAAVAGLLAAIIRIFLGTPLDLATLPAQLSWMEEFASNMADPQKQRLLEVLSELRGLSSGQLLLRYLLPISLFWAVVLFIVTLLGGLLGVALFENRREPPPDSLPNSNENGTA